MNDALARFLLVILAGMVLVLVLAGMGSGGLMLWLAHEEQNKPSPLLGVAESLQRIEVIDAKILEEQVKAESQAATNQAAILEAIKAKRTGSQP